MSEQLIAEQVVEQLLPKLTDTLRSLPDDTEKDRIKRNIESGAGLSSVKDLCVYYKVCPATIYNWIARGRLPEKIKIGGTVRFRNSELKETEL